MALKDLFNSSGKLLSSTSLEETGNEIESAGFIQKSIEDKNKFVPYVDYSNPANFSKFGLAEQYYYDSINSILTTYPYDGSLKEKIEWEISSSNLDKYIFEKEYPRTTGYINLGLNYGNLISSSNNYAQFGTSSYIFFKGGPHTASGGMTDKSLYETFSKSNLYDPLTRRESNLEINGNTGICLEFWLKKNNFISGSESAKQVIFDVWNSASSTSPTYGRFRLEIHPGVSNETNTFYVELSSGSAGLSSGSTNNVIAIGNGLNISNNIWNQYSLTIINSGSSMIAQLYASGSLNDAIITGSSIGLITGSMIGTIGSLLTSSISSGSLSRLGWAKLSGSLDELRFWKVKRNAKQIGRYWFTQVGAGTNTDEANTSLGLYYKFNEGIMSTASVHPLDTKILDYSGRISNGSWIGYVTGSRNTSSAMEEAGVVSNEFRDPIIYSAHSGVLELAQLKQEIGFAHDSVNNANIYGTFPEWITKDDEEKGHGELKKLTQTMASFLDNMYLQIEMLPKIKSTNYISSSFKPTPFVSRFLESSGMISPEIFSEADALELLASRDDYREFSEKISDVKNRIYQNVYNNLNYIYKSKGTEKSFRNLMRCFGIDEELIKINLYGDNVTYELKDNFRYTSVPKKYADFNNVDRFYASVYQHTSSAISSSRSYIAAPNNILFHGNTYQAEAIFPKKFEKDSALFFDTPFTTSSVFGCHTANCVDSNDKTWINPDLGNFQVYAIRPSLESKDVYFALSGTADYRLPVLTSSLFHNVYDNQKWNFNVRIKPSTWPYAGGVSGSSNNRYTVEFNGYNTVMDLISNSFAVSGTISASNGESFMLSPKRFFVGAHRTNFTGSVLQYTDLKISSLRVWMSYLSDESLQLHSKDVSNYGTMHPGRSNYITEISRSFGV